MGMFFATTVPWFDSGGNDTPPTQGRTLRKAVKRIRGEVGGDAGNAACVVAAAWAGYCLGPA